MTCDRHHTKDGEPVDFNNRTQLVWCPNAGKWMTRQVHQQTFVPPEGWA